jgi:hypothetical protein
MGLCLRRVVLQYPRLGWQGSTGIHGSFQSESVATFDWNRWQVSTGISGNFRPEYAIRIKLRRFPEKNLPFQKVDAGLITMSYLGNCGLRSNRASTAFIATFPSAIPFV